MKNKYLLAISAGHLFTDMNFGALVAMLPYLISTGGLTYAQAAGLTFASSLSSSLSQPFFGIIADKVSRTWLLPAGVLLAGCGLSVIGFFPNNYMLMFGAAIISGIGVAAYHPEGARIANKLGGNEKGNSIGIFSVGGTVGIAAGPLVAAPAMLYLGLRGSAVLAIPAIIMFVIIFSLYNKMCSLAEATESGQGENKEEYKNEWGKFLWLGIAISCRSIINHSFNIFLPLYWISVLHQSKATSGMVVSYITIIGAIALIISGRMADRFGMNKINIAGWIFLIPSIYFLTMATNPVLTLLILVPLSVGCYSVNTPLIVLGQQYLPKNMGFASGITLGLGVSIGGVVSPLLGSYADLHGIASTFKLLSILPLLGIVVAFTSKSPAKPLQSVRAEPMLDLWGKNTQG